MYQKKIDDLMSEEREKLVIDLRSEEDYAKETYPQAKNIYWENFVEHEAEIP